jgi:hypothetical protein
MFDGKDGARTGESIDMSRSKQASEKVIAVKNIDP